MQILQPCFPQAGQYIAFCNFKRSMGVTISG